MTYIKDTGRKYTEEYKKLCEKVNEENKQTLKKAGVTPSIFEEKQTNNSSLLLSTKDSVSKSGAESKQKSETKTYEETPVEEIATLNDIKASSGALNTIYKRTLRAYNSANDDDTKNNYHEYTSSLEETNGKDVNDELADFFTKNYKKGLHINGGGLAYLEEGKISSVYSVNGNVSGSYKDKNEKLTLLYNGSFEYESEKSKENGTEKNEVQKNGNALLLAKYKTDRLTFGGGGSAYFYDNDTKLYNLYAGATDNRSGITLTLNRKIQVVNNTIENQTDVKVNVIQQEDAEDFSNTIPDIPTPEKTKEAESLVSKEKEEVKDIVTKDYKKGFGLDLILSSASNADEYGAIAKYAVFYKKDENLKMGAASYLGLSDYHPSSHEGIKFRSGTVCTVNYTAENKTDIKAVAVIDNKRILQPGNPPQNTFMVALDTTVKKDKFAVSVSTGYINSNSDVKHMFVTGSLEYKMKKSMLAVTAGYQDCDISSEQDNIFYSGIRYAVNF